MMKQIASLALGILLMAGVFCAPVSAGDSTTLTYYHDGTTGGDPTYTVTIPTTVALSVDGETGSFEASEVKNLPADKKIAVTIVGTSNLLNNLTVNNTDNSMYYHDYKIVRADGSEIVPHKVLNATTNSVVGQELCAFTENGTANLTFQIHKLYENQPAGNYTGTITYGIALADRA